MRNFHLAGVLKSVLRNIIAPSFYKKYGFRSGCEKNAIAQQVRAVIAQGCPEFENQDQLLVISTLFSLFYLFIPLLGSYAES